MGASEELPFGSHFISPVSGSLTWLSVVLLQSMPARRVDLTPTSLVASAPPDVRVTLPTVGSNPFPATSYLTKADHKCTIVIFPSVRVPVLSLQITEADPRVSTAANLRTSTFSFTMELLPMEREMVTHNGIPSGIAATAKVTAMRIMYSHDGLSWLSGSLVLIATPMTKTMMQTAMAPTPILFPSFSTFSCSGVWLVEVSGKQKHCFFAAVFPPVRCCAISPIRVLMPVATTMPFPLPLVQLQLEKHMFSGVSFSSAPG
mmetsp:Transcript_5591/g.10515  ORF Transcript_5591/g.10515 Transcript_5591/m.10515 type:complete len:260 (-) Transcript_5591:653-1432(-)